MDEGGRVCGTKGVATACRQSQLPFESFVEGRKIILPRLQGLVIGDFAVSFGAVLGGVVRLEEQGGCDGSKKVVQKGEFGALCLFLAVPKAI